MIKILDQYKSISFIGMSKNAGKTTALNYFIDQTRGNKTLGLSSVGRDGETLDRVTGTSKPKIYIYSNSIIATATSCLKLSDATLEILEVTDFSTPMGKIVIARAISDGYVELAGPSTNWQTKIIMDKMLKYGAQLIFIDGAISRKSLASPSIADATIMSTGASLAHTISTIVEETSHSYNLLTTKACADNGILSLISSHKYSTIIADLDNFVTYEDNKTIIGNERFLSQQIDTTTKFIYTSGAITDSFIDILLRNTRLKLNLTIIVEDGTKLFINPDNLSRIEKRGWHLCVVNPINLIAITVNPFSDSDYFMNSSLIIEELSKHIPVPVFDVKGGVLQ